MAIELLQVLSVQRTRQWHDIVTLDESWIYSFSEHDLMWTDPGEIVVDRGRDTVQSPKFMLTVVWNPIGFLVLKVIPKGRKFNAQYYTNDISVAISDWRRQTGGIRPNKLWVHSDNARPYTAKMSRDYIGLNRMKKAPHLPYSPDLAPLNFFLFSYVKGKVMGYRTETPSELLVPIPVILAEISQEVLNAVFLEWMELLQKCVQVDGEYVE
jgi:histone-lysine N-methyltransferase SETMAR